MSFCSSLSPPHSLSLLSKSKPFNGDNKAVGVTVSSRIRGSADVPDYLSADWLESRRKRPFGPRLNFSAEEAVQYQLDALKYNDQPRPDYGIEVMYRVNLIPVHDAFFILGPAIRGISFPLNPVKVVQNKENGFGGPLMLLVLVRSSNAKYLLARKWPMKFAGFDPFERSTYFGPFFDLGQFERFRRIFHHSTYRVLLGHKERKILSSLLVKENRFKQRVWVQGNRPEEEEIFQFTMVQRVGGSWDGYWLTESLLNDGNAFAGGLAY